MTSNTDPPVVSIDLILFDTALSKRVPILAVESEILTLPSILESKTSSWADFKEISLPSVILSVIPEGKLARVSPYLSMISCISEAFPLTTNSIFPIS